MALNPSHISFQGRHFPARGMAGTTFPPISSLALAGRVRSFLRNRQKRLRICLITFAPMRRLSYMAMPALNARTMMPGLKVF